MKKSLLALAITVALLGSTACSSTTSEVSKYIDKYCSLSTDLRAIAKSVADAKLYPNEINIECRINDEKL